VDWKDLDRLRTPGFAVARRGYDRHEVDRFLAALVDWLETDAAREIGHLAVTRKLELVGKSTTHILLAAEQEAEEMLRQVEADIAELHAEAQAAARDIRRAADEYAEHVREGAEREARHTREEATADASQTIEEGLRRRAQIDDEVKALQARRRRLGPDGQASVGSSSQGTLT
jgi:DivIVA domain-containing protein